MIRLIILLLAMHFYLPAHASVVYYLAAAPEEKVLAMQNDPKQMAEFLYSSGENKLYLDKMWHGLHWLLTPSKSKTTAPTSKIIMGGKEIGQDIGYGKARYFSSAQVKEIAAQLANVKVTELRRRYQPKAMDKAEIYPNDWVEWERSGDVGIGELLGVFNDLLVFYKNAAKSNYAVVYAWG